MDQSTKLAAQEQGSCFGRSTIVSRLCAGLRTHGERVVRIEGCQVINPPVVERWEEKDITGIVRKKQWKCTFVAPPDLWSQVRDEWIQASTESKKDITVLNRLKLNNGDMCTVIGIHTGERDEPMASGEKQRHLTFLKVTEVIPGIRGSSRKANVLQPKARQG